MKKYVLSLTTCLLSLCHATAQRQWTLDECMDYAMTHNTEIMHLQYEQQRRQTHAQAAKDARLPRFYGDMGGYTGTFRFKGDDKRFDAYGSMLNMGLSGVLPLYTGNRLSSQIKANEYSLMAASENVRSAGKNIKAQVAAAYLQLLYNKGEVSIARQRQEYSRLLLKRATSLYDRGRRPESEVAEAEAIVSRDEAWLTAAKGDVELALLDLKMLLNLPDSVNFDICDLTDDMDADSLSKSSDPYTQEAAHHPSVKSAHFGILQAEQGVKTARSGYYPTLSLVGELGTLWLNLDTRTSYSRQLPLTAYGKSFGNLNYNINYETSWKQKNLFYGFVGLKLSIPIFDAFDTKAHIRNAKVNLEDARLTCDDARRRVEKDIRQAWQSAVAARKRYEAERKAVEAVALSYSYALKRYDAGIATLFDLNQMHQQWFAASENALRMRCEYLIRKRILDIHTQD